MPKERTSFESLKPYLPAGSFEMVMPYIYQYKVQLTLTRERKTILGNYMAPFEEHGHKISINANLNKYSFLITLLHELAHLFTWVKYGHKVAAHGKEWKEEYRVILKNFIQEKFFPAPIENALVKGLHNPAASSCGDENLLREIKKYDNDNLNLFFVEELPPETKFETSDGRLFLKGEKLRKRFKCKEVNSGKFYLFSGVYEVKMISENNIV